MIEKIKQFILDNSIPLTEGSRNSSVTILIGYSQHLKASKEDLKAALENEIKNDKFIEEEIDRLWLYCSANKYANYWITETASNTYKF